MPGEEGDRLGIGSVETAAAILGALAEGGGQMPLGALADAAGMHRAKVHRYLISLTRTGLVAQPERNGAYSIGPSAISIGLAGLRRVDPIRIAYEALPELRDRVDETVFLAIWGDMGVTCIGLEESAHPVTLNIRVGSVLPFLSTAAGQVFAAYMPRARVDRFDEQDRKQSRRRPAVAVKLSRAPAKRCCGRSASAGWRGSGERCSPGSTPWPRRYSTTGATCRRWSASWGGRKRSTSNGTGPPRAS